MKFIYAPGFLQSGVMETISQKHTGPESSNLSQSEGKKSLERLMAGNRRFFEGIRSIEPMMAHKKMPDLAANGQKPYAIVLTCSDSRSPVEMIFDQGVGDVFVVRVAGNVVAPSLLASIEFAAANFGSSLILVLGHTQCGAVKATIDHCCDTSKQLPSPHLEELVGRIRPAIEGTEGQKEMGTPEFQQRATLSNVRRSLNLIHEQSRIVRDLVQAGKVEMAGAVLDISSGRVSLI